jgi:hypothetical protein
MVKFTPKNRAIKDVKRIAKFKELADKKQVLEIQSENIKMGIGGYGSKTGIKSNTAQLHNNNIGKEIKQPIGEISKLSYFNYTNSVIELIQKNQKRLEKEDQEKNQKLDKEIDELNIQIKRAGRKGTNFL